MIYALLIIALFNIGATKVNSLPGEEKCNFDRKIDFDTVSVIFDSLSCVDKRKFIEQHKKKIKPNALLYLERHPEINNLDSLFDITVSCRLDSLKNREMLSFNVYIITHIVANKKLDGYIGEFFANMYFALFYNYQGYFYQYLDYVDKYYNNDTKESILGYVTIGCYYNVGGEEALKETFSSHRSNLTHRKKQIDLVESFVQKHILKDEFWLN